MTILSIVGAESLQGKHSAALEPRIQGVQSIDELAAGRFDITGFVKATIEGSVGAESVDCIIPMMSSQSSHGGHRLPLLSTFLITSASASTCPTNITYETTESAEAVAFVKALVPHRDFQWYADSHQTKVAAIGGSSSPETPPRVLIIAGSDSGGGAGIQADMKACTNLKAFSSTAITAVTVQNTLGVHGIFEIPTDVVRDQIACVMSDIGADVIKTGVLSNEEIIKAVSESIGAWNVPVVVDPVMVATSGDLLLQDAALHELVQSLFPLATIVTPNVPEASALLGSRPISSVEEIKAAAKELATFGPAYVLVKGGHLPGDRVHDVLYDCANDEFFIFSNEKLETNNTHGTGCTLASAIAAKLAAAQVASNNSGTTVDVVAAVKSAIEYLHGILKKSQGLAIGTGNSRPMFHTN